MTGHRALEKKQITQGNNRKYKIQADHRKGLLRKSFFVLKRNSNCGRVDKSFIIITIESQ